MRILIDSRALSINDVEHFRKYFSDYFSTDMLVVIHRDYVLFVGD